MKKTSVLTSYDLVELADSQRDIDEAHLKYMVMIRKRFLVILRMIDKGASYGEIADALKVSRSAVKSYMRKAHK